VVTPTAFHEEYAIVSITNREIMLSKLVPNKQGVNEIKYVKLRRTFKIDETSTAGTVKELDATIKEINADPTTMLYVINDKITGTDKNVFKKLKPSDIKSIRKVIEPAAAAVYGARAANGVVLITTVNYKKKVRTS
jgi:TonB-dependent SusC/RagA subfamily outer membrane receptor